VALSRSLRRWKGGEDAVPVGDGYAGSVVDDADLDVAAVFAGGDDRGLVGWAVAKGVGQQVDQGPFQQGRVDGDLG
jgi:hypothetical protein